MNINMVGRQQGLVSSLRRTVTECVQVQMQRRMINTGVVIETTRPDVQIPPSERITYSRLPAIKAQEPGQQIEQSQVLKLLQSQPSHYVVVRMHDTHKYLLTPRDSVTVSRLKDVNVGDVIRFTRIVEVGSRDYTLRDEGDTYMSGLPSSIVTCSATVEEHFEGAEHTVVKSKRRKRYRRTVSQKHRWTRLRIGDVVIGE